MSMMKRHLRRYLDAYMHLSVQLHLTPSFQTPNHSRDGDLSYNRLTGKIPFNIGFLQVVTLSLQGNQLSEQIPSVIGLMQALAVLDLSCNMLTGPIPPILGNFTYMEKLCVILDTCYHFFTLVLNFRGHVGIFLVLV
ncbi:LRR receptor-like serine/threonine-protein kinase ER2 isoform X1 [Eucalyptus grandis]|uniref:LRR receptor-like serine/threonine-protein kinase ER2 isoform X1 n=1 Tax=Eucalyptus grandis TaxID=71139 RepID=UPI00192E8E96|nr:LRR receptor-like serine/threonine-protein kinase ER2 isoform X1 [Eucalyptus grandis]